MKIYIYIYPSESPRQALVSPPSLVIGPGAMITPDSSSSTSKVIMRWFFVSQ